MKINKRTKVFVAGCGGMLGEAVYKQFSKNAQVLATDIDLNEKWLKYADVCDFRKTFAVVSKFKPRLIINLAALTDLEYCERNAEHAWKVNALGAENMALIAQKLDVPHVYISTAGVFDGAQEFYNDFDQPNPLGIYAKSKYYGEIAVQRMLKQYYIFRAGWMMGGGVKKDKKFIGKVFKQLRSGKRELFVVTDKLGTPTYTHNFAESIFKIVQTEMYGLYNMVCGGSCTRYDVAGEFVRLLGLEKSVKVTQVSSDHFREEYFAPRPPSEKLVNLKLETRGINFMRDWRACLKDYAGEFRPALNEAK